MKRLTPFLLLLALLLGGNAWGQNWQIATQDNFTRGAYPTSANGANGTNVGAPDTAGTGSWIDANGGVWVVTAAGNLRCTNDSTNGNNFQRDFLLRPNQAAETKSSQRVVFTTVGTASSLGTYSWGCALRYQSTNTMYCVAITNGQLQLWRFNGGSNTQLQVVSITGYDSTLPYVMDAAVTGTTSAVFNITVKQAGVTKSSVTSYTDASTPVALQSTGQVGLMPFSNAGIVQSYSQFILYWDAPLVLAAGSVSQTAISSSGVSLSCTAATGGTAPYTYQWARSGNPVTGYSNIGGATSLTVTDSPPNTLVFYKLTVTDSAGTPATASTVAFPVQTLSAAYPTLSLGFIGDSITNYTNSGTYADSPYQETLRRLQGIAGSRRTVNLSASVNQSVSGTKTTDWVSGGTYLPGAKTAFATQSVTVISLMLGTNDAGAGVSAATFKTNLQSCVNDLVAAGYKVILHYPAYRTSNGSQVGTVDQQNDLLLQYQAQIDSLINGTTILAGDKTIFGYQAIYQELFDGIHPDFNGVQSYGRVWSTAIASALGITTGAGTKRKVQ